MSTIASSPYTYTLLDKAAYEIRILTLHPGAFTDPVTVSLTITSFTPSQVPVFEALSYAWGSPEKPENILVRRSEESGYDTLSVTQNLSLALPYLRYKDKSRALWIDAICVNQLDLQERSQQVKRMAEIYMKATRVIAWLGPASETTIIARKCFDEIASHIDVDWARLVMQAHSVTEDCDSDCKSCGLDTESWYSCDTCWANLEKTPPFKEAEWLAISEFLHYAWFERLWIYQEIHLGSENSILQCGCQIMDWTSFCKAIFLLQSKQHLLGSRFPEHSYAKFRNRLNIIYNICRQGEYMPFQTLLERTKGCKCSDPRDRVFALLSLLDDNERGCAIDPDYTKSVSDVYKETMVKIIKISDDWEIFGSVEMDEGVIRIPSWIPDWSVPRRSASLPHFLASGFSKSVADFLKEGIISVHGKIVDSIQVVEPFNTRSIRGTERRRRSKVLCEVQRVLSSLMPVDSGQDKIALRSICRTLCGGVFSDRYIPPAGNHMSLTKAEEELAVVLCDEQEAQSYFSPRLAGAIMACCIGRSMFKTTKGYIGLAPKATRHGDIVTVLLGCPTPTILRPTHHPETFQVVGTAYCDGFMSGEALLGSLPNGFEAVLKFNEEEKAYYSVFFNSETCIFQLEDPRLSQIPLPIGWKVKDHELKEWWSWFVNDISREDNGPGDPRLSPESLRERGVEIQRFDLV
jgi:hypothetical protein